MSTLIRATLNHSNETSIALSNEIDYLKNYLDLEAIRFEDDFDYTIVNEVPAELQDIQIPTMVLQPHIENAVRHGLKPKKQGRKLLSLRLSIIDEMLLCEIDDNGVGRQHANSNTTSSIQHISQGEKLSDAKLSIFKQMTGRDAYQKIIDKTAHGKPLGTCIKVYIKL